MKIRILNTIHEYSCVNGETMIDGLSLDQFLDTLTPDQLITLTELGIVVADDIANDQYRKHPGKYQYLSEDKKELKKHLDSIKNF